MPRQRARPRSIRVDSSWRERRRKVCLLWWREVRESREARRTRHTRCNIPTRSLNIREDFSSAKSCI